MATEIVISNNDYIVSHGHVISWVDRGNAMPSLPSTIHYVIWNELPGQNEIQTKDPSTGLMAGNTPLNSVSDAVGSTTISELLAWFDTRKAQIRSAQIDASNSYENGLTQWLSEGKVEGDYNSGNLEAASYHDWSKTWIDYDEHYS